MRVLYIDVNCKNSSTGKIVYDLYTQCRAEGNEAAVCYGRGAKIDEENIYKFGLDFETYFHAFMTRITGWTGCFSPISTHRLLKYIEKFKPDVIHLHEPHAYFLNLKQFFDYIRKNNIPLVYTFHCEFAYTGKCGFTNQCERWKTGCGKCPNNKNYPASMFFDNTAKMHAEKKQLLLALNNVIYTAPSKWLAGRAKQSFLSGKDIRVVNNGINTDSVFYPRNYQHLKEKHKLTDEKIILAVAPDLMSQRKGGRWVLKIAEKMKNENVKFILLGALDLTEQFPDNVIALGRTEDQNVLAEYYSLADCFVICSSIENFPTTSVEAACCGTPVVGFYAGGTAETAPAPIGDFCKYGDVNSLIESIHKMLDNKPSKSEFEKLRQHYSSKRMYLEHYELYQELTKKKDSVK